MCIRDTPPFTGNPAVISSLDVVWIGSGNFEIDIEDVRSLDSGAKADSCGAV